MLRPLKLADPPPSNFEVQKYKRTKFWAITFKDSGHLVAVVTYRKGAREIVQLLDRLVELERKFAGLQLIKDLVEHVPARRIADN